MSGGDRTSALIAIPGALMINSAAAASRGHALGPLVFLLLVVGVIVCGAVTVRIRDRRFMRGRSRPGPPLNQAGPRGAQRARPPAGAGLGPRGAASRDAGRVAAGGGARGGAGARVGG